MDITMADITMTEVIMMEAITAEAEDIMVAEDMDTAAAVTTNNLLIIRHLRSYKPNESLNF
jgi:hypothetical protein